MQENLPCIAAREDLAFAHELELVRDTQGRIRAGIEQHHRPVRWKRGKQRQDMPTRVWIKIRQGLVKDQEARFKRERCRDHQPLLFAARKGEGIAIRKVPDPALSHRPLGPGPDFGQRQIEVFRPERDFLAHREGAARKMALRDLPDKLDRRRALGRRPFRPRPVIARNRAAVPASIGQPACQPLRQRRLAASIAAEDRKPRSGRYHKVDIRKHEAVAIGKAES